MAPTTDTADPRPRLAVVYGHRSLDVMQIREAARGWCDLVWLVDSEDPTAAAVLPLLRRFGVVVDALGASPADAAQALAAHSPDGLATFYDTGMEHVAAIATELGLRFHSVEAARALEDKLHQRAALRDGGLSMPRTAALPKEADRSAVERLGSSIHYPAVLKPRRASGSWHTFAVADAGALGELWEDLEHDGREDMLVEEYLPDGPAMPQGFEADYVSVETVIFPGRMLHLAVTGRFPLAPPFRETGYFIPATLAPEQEREVLDLAGHTLSVLGLRAGAAHTEIKLTAEGMRVIEVNGRIGGGVPEMLRLAAGVDIIRLNMQAALGWDPDVPELPPTSGVGYRFFYQPPQTARRLTSIDGLERLKLLPGYESAYLHLQPGTEINANHGTRTYLFAMVGWARDHAGVQAADDFLRTEIQATYEHRDGHR